jgi:hypothetical protein
MLLLVNPGPQEHIMRQPGKNGCLAMRQEGNLWCAYYALPDTMEGAEFLGAMHMHFMQDPKHEAAFFGLMKNAVRGLRKEKTGERPVWPGSMTQPSARALYF